MDPPGPLFSFSWRNSESFVTFVFSNPLTETSRSNPGREKWPCLTLGSGNYFRRAFRDQTEHLWRWSICIKFLSSFFSFVEDVRHSLLIFLQFVSGFNHVTSFLVYIILQIHYLYALIMQIIINQILEKNLCK